MDLQQWFYILGIAYIVSWLIILLALALMGVVAYRRYQLLKREVRSQGAFFFATSSLLRQLPMAKLVPLIGAIPLATKFIKMFTQKDTKRNSD
jgi:hypothetical protein